jgi:hypothetical protein
MLHTSPYRVDEQQQSRWLPTRGQVLRISGIGAVLIVYILIGHRYGITLWDWIKLLIVPAVNAGGGIWQQRLISIESGPIVALKWANCRRLTWVKLSWKVLTCTRLTCSAPTCTQQSCKVQGWAR